RAAAQNLGDCHFSSLPCKCQCDYETHVTGTDRLRLVGATRFELATPCTPCKCATRLRHAPTEGPNDSPNGLWVLGCCNASAAQDLDEFFEFQAHLVNELLALVQVDLG